MGTAAAMVAARVAESYQGSTPVAVSADCATQNAEPIQASDRAAVYLTWDYGPSAAAVTFLGTPDESSLFATFGSWSP